MQFHIVLFGDNAVLHVLIKHIPQFLTPQDLRFFLFNPLLQFPDIQLLKRDFRDLLHGPLQVKDIADLHFQKMQDRLFQPLRRDPVACALLRRLIPGTHIIPIFFIPGTHILPHHGRAAVRTYHHARQRVHLGLLRGHPRIHPQKPLHNGKIPVRNHRLMVLLNPHPVLLRLHNRLLHLMVRRRLPALHQIPDITFIFQNPPYRDRTPQRPLPGLKTGLIIAPGRTLILHRRQHPRLIQPARNGVLAHAVQLHTENIPHNTCRHRVNDKPVPAPLVLLIPIGCKRTDKLPVLPLHLQMAPYLHRNIPAVCVIYQIFERYDNLV